MKALNFWKVLVFLAVLLVLVLVPTVSVKPANAQASLATVILLSDGSISPSTAPIMRNGNTYTLTGDLNAAIKIQKSGIVLDGDGYTLSGIFNGNSTDIWVVGTGPDPNKLDYYTIGVDLGGSNVDGITVKNLKVENFSIGMYIWTQNNTVTENSVSNNIVGLLVSGSNGTITKNYISDNIEGLFFGSNSASGESPPDMIVYQNSLIKNNVQVSGCQCKTYNLTETPHYWDNGKVGNYWSDYNGTDANGDGIGDTAYVIDPLDLDRYPLMQSPVQSTLQTATVSFESITLGVLAVTIAIIASVFVYKQRKKK
jgi:parallel beta-helix repeat protein